MVIFVSLKSSKSIQDTEYKLLLILHLDGESLELIAQNGKDTLELKEEITATGW